MTGLEKLSQLKKLNLRPGYAELSSGTAATQKNSHKGAMQGHLATHLRSSEYVREKSARCSRPLT